MERPHQAAAREASNVANGAGGASRGIPGDHHAVVKGSHEPTSAAYVAMSNLAGAPDGIYFWERAGIDTEKFPDMNLRISLSSLQVNLKDFNLVTTKKLSAKVMAEGTAAWFCHC